MGTGVAVSENDLITHTKMNLKLENLTGITGTATLLGLTATFTGATEDNAAEITVTDGKTNSSGYSRALYLSATASGTKSGSGEHNSLGIDLTVTGTTPYAYIASLYMVATGNPDIELASALSIYIDNLGTDCQQLYMADLQYGSTNAPTIRNAYMRMRNHSDNTPTTIMLFKANNNMKAATYLIEQEAGTIGPAEAGALTNDTIGTTPEDGFINVLIGGVAAKIPFWYDN